MEKFKNALVDGITNSVAGMGLFYKIKDKTDENTIQNINYRQQALEDQERAWAREDAIRKETQAREDTAYRRAVEDARKAGINPNLVGITPAGSGGGISSATPIDYTMQQAEYDRETQQKLAEYERETKRILQIMEQEFEMDQKEKDRIARLLSGGLIAGSIKQK